MFIGDIVLTEDGRKCKVVRIVASHAILKDMETKKYSLLATEGLKLDKYEILKSEGKDIYMPEPIPDYVLKELFENIVVLANDGYVKWIDKNKVQIDEHTLFADLTCLIKENAETQIGWLHAKRDKFGVSFNADKGTEGKICLAIIGNRIFKINY